MKKLLSILSTFVLFLSLTACAPGKTLPGTPSNGNSLPGANYLPESNITLQVGESTDTIKSGVADLIARAFEEKYKYYNIKVEIVQFDPDNLELNGPAGFAPDVFESTNDHGQWYAGKLVMPVDPVVMAFEDNKDIPMWAWDSFKYNGQYFGYPITVQTTTLQYRKSLIPEEFKNSDGTLAVESWNDLYALNKGIKDGTLTVPNGMSRGVMFSPSIPYEKIGFLTSYGGYIFDKDDKGNYDISSVQLHNGEAYKGLKVIRDFTPTMYDIETSDEVLAQIPAKIAGGEYFGTISTSNSVSNIASQLVKQGVFSTIEEAKADIVCVKLPLLPKDGDITTPLEDGEETIENMSMGGLTGYMINSFTKYPNASRLYAAFATNSEWTEKRSKMADLASVRISNQDKMEPVAIATFDQASDGRLYVMPSVPELQQVWVPVQTIFYKVGNALISDKYDYDTDEKIIKELQKLSEEIDEAINTFRD